MHLLLSLHRLGTTVVVASHNDRLVRQHGFPVLEMAAGRLLGPGPGRPRRRSAPDAGRPAAAARAAAARESAGRALACLASGLVCLSVLAFAVAAGAQGRLRHLALEPRVRDRGGAANAAGPASEAGLAAVVEALRAAPGHRAPARRAGRGAAAAPAGGSRRRRLLAGPAPAPPHRALVRPGEEPDRAALAARLAGVAPEAVVGEPAAGGAEGAATMRLLRMWVGPRAPWRWRA